MTKKRAFVRPTVGGAFWQFQEQFGRPYVDYETSGVELVDEETGDSNPLSSLSAWVSSADTVTVRVVAMSEAAVGAVVWVVDSWKH